MKRIVLVFIAACAMFGMVAQNPQEKADSLTLDSLANSMANGVMLQDVVVKGKKSAFVSSIDRKIFNVGSDIQSSTGTLSELMRSIPSVQVDVDGNVSLRGSENVLVLIDGKPSMMMNGKSRATSLQQLPSNMFERIEVITNPSAQYKPDGTAGIINLVTKKVVKPGFSGTVTANVGNQSRYNCGVSLGYSTPKLRFNVNYGYRKDRRDRYINNTRTLTDATTGIQTDYNQHTDSKARSTSNIIGGGLGWNITSRDKIDFTGSYTHMTFPRDEDNRLIESIGSTVLQDYVRHRHDQERQNQTEWSAAYSHSFGTDRTLTADYTHSVHDEVERNNYSNIFTVPAISTTMDNTLIKQRENENLIRAIYESKNSNNDKLVAGYEAEIDNSDMFYYVDNLINGSWVKNLDLSNDYTFRERVHSLYGTYERHFNERFAAELGLRAEMSLITSNLLTLNQKIKDNYFYLYPTFHSTYQLDGNNEFQLNYSLRVNRPEGDDLNPFPEYKDPYNIRKGNPYLRPEKIHSIEAGWEWKHASSSVILTPYCRYTTNKMTDITTTDAKGVMTTTMQNMNNSLDGGVEMVFDWSPIKSVKVDLSSNVFYNQIDASDLGYSSRKGAMAWLMALNANANLTDNFAIQLNTHYNSSTLTPQGHRNATYIANLGAKYDFPKYGISLIATASDLFNTFRYVETIDTPLLKQRVERKRTARIFYVGLSWRFGNGKTKNNHEIKYDENL